MSDLSPIAITAIFNNVRTTVDGGWRLTLDLDQGQTEAIQKITDHRDTLLQIAIVPEESD